MKSHVRGLMMTALAITSLWLVGCEQWQEKYEMCSADMEELQRNFDASQEALMECNQAQGQLRQELAACNQGLAMARDELQKKPTFEGEDAKWDAAKGTLTVSVATDVLFDSGKATLKSTAQQRLQNIATVLKRDYGGKEVYIIGYTDTDPIRKSKWKDNWELSCQRSLAVTRYLIDKSVDAEALTAAGRGEFHPLQTKNASRRVEIVVHLY